VLENHHCARAFEWILGTEESNIFSTFSPEKYKTIRENTLSLVLATDMAYHFPYISKFKNKINGAREFLSFSFLFFRFKRSAKSFA
jgi:hypothetical protein